MGIPNSQKKQTNARLCRQEIMKLIYLRRYKECKKSSKDGKLLGSRGGLI